MSTLVLTSVDSDMVCVCLVPPQDVIAVSGNPAYEQVTLKSIAVQENSAYSAVHTPVEDTSQHSAIPASANPAYGEVTGIALHENSAYSHTTLSSPVAQYENINRTTCV